MLKGRRSVHMRGVRGERPNPKTRQRIKLGPGRTIVLEPAPDVLGTSSASAAEEAKPWKQ
jgi:hypothetical protein